MQRMFRNVSESDQRRLLWENARALYGLQAEPILADRTRFGVTPDRLERTQRFEAR
jgi:hypothetical protein